MADLADRAFRAGVPIRLALKRAGMDYSTWWRWVKGGGYHPAKLEQLETALAAIIEEDHG